MRIEVSSSPNLQAERMRAYAEYRVFSQLAVFAAQVNTVRVVVRQSADDRPTLCTISAGLRNGGQIRSRSRDTQPARAVDSATKQLAEATNKRLSAATAESMIALKRAYDPVSNRDGTRFLVERLWPRGISKAKLRTHVWLKEVGPSTELRKWFSHDPDKWDEFRRRYFRELRSQPEAWRPLLSAARRGRVTLVYSSHDTQHNNAVALQEFLRTQARRPARSKRTSAAHRPRTSPR